MSHFTVMVIGENPEDQLEPYSEGIEMERYSTGEVSQDDIDRFLSVYTVYDPERTYAKLSQEEVDENLKLSLDELVEKYKDDWGTDWEMVDGVWHEFSTYNPNSKWDWYSLGGRWTGFLKLKDFIDTKKNKVGTPGLMTKKAEKGFADACLKKNIDVAYMRAEAVKSASEVYDYVTSFISKYPKAKSWEDVQKEHEDIEDTREAYWNQPVMKAWQAETHPKDLALGWGISLEDFNISKEDYLQDASDKAIMTFALLKDGQWSEKGKMGWWGCVSDEKDKKSWTREFNDLFDSLPEDTLISIYDCHI